MQRPARATRQQRTRTARPRALGAASGLGRVIVCAVAVLLAACAGSPSQSGLALAVGGTTSTPIAAATQAPTRPAAATATMTSETAAQPTATPAPTTPATATPVAQPSATPAPARIVPTATPTKKPIATPVAEATSAGASQRATSGTPAAAPGTAEPAATAPAVSRNVGRVTAIGDSVMLGAAPELRQDLGTVDVDAAVSRQVAAGIGVLASRRAAGQLGPTVVIHLGTNGTFTAGEFDQIMQILQGERRVVFVNVRVDRSWEPGNNAVIAAGVQRYGTTRLVDWHGAASARAGLFANDGFHLRPEGAALYASLIASAVEAP